ncbi:proton-conducting transporter membrane subunit, partial [Halomonas sp. SIMBA_159]
SIMGGTYSIRELIAQAPELAQHDFFIWALVLVLLGAFTKSAQFPFYIWLPDAMEGPTPVSARIHAATMVTAGVFMLCGLSPALAYATVALDVIGVVGAATAFFAATIGMAQNDI